MGNFAKVSVNSLLPNSGSGIILKTRTQAFFSKFDTEKKLFISLMLGFSKIGIWIRSPLSVIKNPPKTIVDAFIVAVCRFDQGAAVEGAGVGFLKNSVLNIPFQMKERSSDVFQTTFLPFKAEAVLQMERNAETSDKFQDVFLRLVTLFLLKWEGHRHLYPLRRQYPSRHFFFDFDRL